MVRGKPILIALINFYIAFNDDDCNKAAIVLWIARKGFLKEEEPNVSIKAVTGHKIDRGRLVMEYEYKCEESVHFPMLLRHNFQVK